MDLHVICSQCGEHSVYYDTLSVICGNKLYDFACPICGGLYIG